MMTTSGGRDLERTDLIKKLITQGVISDESEFEDFLEKRRQAIKYNRAADENFIRSEDALGRHRRENASEQARVSSYSQNEIYNMKKNTVVHRYYKSSEYKKVRYEKFITNLHLTCTTGGRNIQDCFGKNINYKKDAMPLGLSLNEKPESNITIVNNACFIGYGGYFGKEVQWYDKPKSADLLISSALEFENFSIEDIRKQNSFLSTKKKGNYKQKLNVGYDKDKGKFEAINQNNEKSLEAIYIDAKKYKQDCKNRLKDKILCFMDSQIRVGNNQPLELHLNLAGLGVFAELDAIKTASIKDTLAPIMAEAYHEVFKELGERQTANPDIKPQIVEVKLSYNPNPMDPESKALDRAFGSYPKLGNINISKTTEFVENLNHVKTGLHCVVFSNGDARSMNNELNRTQSQEPGIIANVVGGRELTCALIDPFKLQVQCISIENMKPSSKLNMQEYALNMQLLDKFQSQHNIKKTEEEAKSILQEAWIDFTRVQLTDDTKLNKLLLNEWFLHEVNGGDPIAFLKLDHIERAHFENVFMQPLVQKIKTPTKPKMLILDDELNLLWKNRNTLDQHYKQVRNPKLLYDYLENVKMNPNSKNKLIENLGISARAIENGEFEDFLDRISLDLKPMRPVSIVPEKSIKRDTVKEGGNAAPKRPGSHTDTLPMFHHTEPRKKSITPPSRPAKLAGEPKVKPSALDMGVFHHEMESNKPRRPSIQSKSFEENATESLGKLVDLLLSDKYRDSNLQVVIKLSEELVMGVSKENCVKLKKHLDDAATEIPGLSDEGLYKHTSGCCDLLIRATQGDAESGHFVKK